MADRNKEALLEVRGVQALTTDLIIISALMISHSVTMMKLICASVSLRSVSVAARCQCQRSRACFG